MMMKIMGNKAGWEGFISRYIIDSENKHVWLTEHERRQ